MTATVLVQSCLADICSRLRQEQAQFTKFQTNAVMADSVYNPPGQRVAPPGYSEVTDPKELAKLGLLPGNLTPQDSEFRAAVFKNVDGSYVVAFRGSTSAIIDWINNIQQAVGIHSDYYSRAQAIATRLATTPGVKVSYTGHSLGGGLASAAAKASGSDAVTFNAAGLAEDTVPDPKTGGHIDAVYVRGELVSAIQRGPLPKAAASESWPLDPPSGVGAAIRRLLVEAGGGLVGSLSGPIGTIAAAMVARGAYLHKMSNVTQSLADRQHEIVQMAVDNGCGGG